MLSSLFDKRFRRDFHNCLSEYLSGLGVNQIGSSVRLNGENCYKVNGGNLAAKDYID